MTPFDTSFFFLDERIASLERDYQNLLRTLSTPQRVSPLPFPPNKHEDLLEKRRKSSVLIPIHLPYPPLLRYLLMPLHSYPILYASLHSNHDLFLPFIVHNQDPSISHSSSASTAPNSSYGYDAPGREESTLRSRRLSRGYSKDDDDTVSPLNCEREEERVLMGVCTDCALCLLGWIRAQFMQLPSSIHSRNLIPIRIVIKPQRQRQHLNLFLNLQSYHLPKTTSITLLQSLQLFHHLVKLLLASLKTFQPQVGTRQLLQSSTE